MPDIFLSYNREDQPRAKLFAEALKAAGFEVWWDVGLRTGEAYDEVTETALRQAKAVIVLWSKKSAASRWVRAEATLADRNKTLLPVMVEPCERPIMFELTQTAELAHWQGDATDKTWLGFLSDVKRFVDKDRAAAAIQPAVTLAQIVAGPAEPLETMLAVLPFDNLSEDKEMQFFSDGVSEEIIQRLARGANLKVIGRTTSFQFRGERKGEAARALKCSHVLDGSVRRAGARVRVAAHLVECSSHVTLWSDRFDRSIEDTFAVQDEISERIAAALDQTFKLNAGKAVAPAAYDLYLRAMPQSYAPDDLHRCIALLEPCIVQAPQFADAWGRLAHLRAYLRTYEPFAGRAQTAAKIQEEAKHALRLDPQNVGALSANALVIAPYGNFIELNSAVEQLRQLPEALGARSWTPYLTRPMGYVRQSLEDAERGFALDPLSTFSANALSLARMAAGKYDGVVTMYEDLVVRSPEMHFARANLMRAYAFLGHWDGVARLLDPSVMRPLLELEDGVLFVKTKRDPSAENVGQMRNRLLTRYEQNGGVEMSNLVYAAHVGLVDDVYRIAETARLGPRGAADDVVGIDAYRTGMLFWKDMPEIRNDPRFVKLCARLGLVEFWLKSGKWPDCADSAPYDFRAECEKRRDYPKDRFFQ